MMFSTQQHAANQWHDPSDGRNNSPVVGHHRGLPFRLDLIGDNLSKEHLHPSAFAHGIFARRDTRNQR